MPAACCQGYACSIGGRVYIVAGKEGDTAASERASMLKRPPNFLITTPESLYLLVTADRSRAMLRSVQTLIVDEIHAVAGNKRGSHLVLTLERLGHVVEDAPQRIGLSATQRPIETIARLLVGAGTNRSTPDGSPRCAIVDNCCSGRIENIICSMELASNGCSLPSSCKTTSRK